MLKKSYVGFVLWMLAFMAAVLGAALLPIEDEALLMRIVDNLCTLGIEALMLLIYKTERVFWINGISFEEAVKAGSGRRRALAFKYVKFFGMFAAGFLLYSVIAQLLHLPWGIDIGLLCAGMLVFTLGALRFRL